MTRDRRFVTVGLIVAVLLAGVVSLYASSAPDGLERVAAGQGFGSTAEEHPLNGSPLADYGTKGVEDERLSTGVAGVAGVAITFAIGGGLFMLIRRPGSTGQHRAARDGASAP